MSVCLYVCNSDFLIVAKYQALANVVQAQRNNISNLMVLDLWKKAFFTFYAVICSPWMPLWHVPDSPEDKPASNISLQINSYADSKYIYAVNKPAVL